jgi:hypothetical protein
MAARPLIPVIGEIKGVRQIEIDGRPQLVLDVVENGRPHVIRLDRELARALRKALGPHPLVDAFFAKGQGLQ